MIKNSLLASLYVCGLLMALSAPSIAAAHKTNIAVAANFTAAAKEIARAFQEKTGFEAILSFGSTGKLYAQIRHGAPFSAFLAADAERPERLETEGQIVPQSRFTYAMGKIALYSSQADAFSATPLSDLSKDTFQRIAIANPKTAPYGAAAIATLEKAGILTQVEGKLIRGENIAQTYQFVATGNVEAGFVALSQTVKTKSGSIWVVPEGQYDPIKQQAVLLKKGADDPVAQAFMAFLKSPEARSIIKSFGYGMED